MRSSSEVLSRSPKIARRAGIAFSFIRIVYHAAGSRPLLRRTLLRLRRTHLLRERSRNRQFLRRVCAPKRKARHADGRSGAAGPRSGTVRFSNTNLVTNQLGGPRRVNEERGRGAGGGVKAGGGRREGLIFFIPPGSSGTGLCRARGRIWSTAPRRLVAR